MAIALRLTVTVPLEETEGLPEALAELHRVALAHGEGEAEKVATCVVARGEGEEVLHTLTERVLDEDRLLVAHKDAVAQPLGEGDGVALCVEEVHCVAVTLAEDVGEGETERLGDAVGVEK